MADHHLPCQVFHRHHCQHCLDLDDLSCFHTCQEFHLHRNLSILLDQIHRLHRRPGPYNSLFHLRLNRLHNRIDLPYLEGQNLRLQDHSKNPFQPYLKFHRYPCRNHLDRSLEKFHNHQKVRHHHCL